MKKTLLMLLSFIIVISIAACGQTDGKAQEGKKEIDAYIKVKHKVKDGKIIVQGKTNLPDGTILGIILTNSQGNKAEQKAEVKRKKYKSGEFTYNGGAFPPGEYKVIVGSMFAENQPEDVQKILGEKGANLTGKQITKSDKGDKTAYIEDTITVKGSGGVTSSDFKDGVMTIKLDAKSAFSVNSVATTYAYHALEAMHSAFADEKVKEVVAIVESNLVDNKGNEFTEEVIKIQYTRKSFEELNYENFKKLASGQEWRIYNEADGYFIHPAIYNEMKDKMRDNLSHGKSKVRRY